MWWLIIFPDNLIKNHQKSFSVGDVKLGKKRVEIFYFLENLILKFWLKFFFWKIEFLSFLNIPLILFINLPLLQFSPSCKSSSCVRRRNLIFHRTLHEKLFPFELTSIGRIFSFAFLNFQINVTLGQFSDWLSVFHNNQSIFVIYVDDNRS